MTLNVENGFYLLTLGKEIVIVNKKNNDQFISQHLLITVDISKKTN